MASFLTETQRSNVDIIRENTSWATQDGRLLFPPDMEERHVFNTLQMLYNHGATQFGYEETRRNYRSYAAYERMAEQDPTKLAYLIAVFALELTLREPATEPQRIQYFPKIIEGITNSTSFQDALTGECDLLKSAHEAALDKIISGDDRRRQEEMRSWDKTQQKWEYQKQLNQPTKNSGFNSPGVANAIARKIVVPTVIYGGFGGAGGVSGISGGQGGVVNMAHMAAQQQYSLDQQHRGNDEIYEQMKQQPSKDEEDEDW